MEVFISGAACRAVFVEGTEAFYVSLDRPTEKVKLGDGRLLGPAVCRALAESPDMQRLSVNSEKEGLLALLAESNNVCFVSVAPKVCMSRVFVYDYAIDVNKSLPFSSFQMPSYLYAKAVTGITLYLR